MLEEYSKTKSLLYKHTCHDSLPSSKKKTFLDIKKFVRWEISPYVQCLLCIKCIALYTQLWAKSLFVTYLRTYYYYYYHQLFVSSSYTYIYFKSRLRPFYINSKVRWINPHIHIFVCRAPSSRNTGLTKNYCLKFGLNPLCIIAYIVYLK